MKRKTIEEIFSDGTKWKMSLRKMQWANPNYGKPRSEETKQKISNSLKDYHANICRFTSKRSTLLKVTAINRFIIYIPLF